jgi:hypothetical protein
MGGPWKDSKVRAGEVSDPYLMTGYDRKRLILKADKAVEITLEVNVDHHGYHKYLTWELKPNELIEYQFPKGYSAHWVRLVADRDSTVSATFIYD